MRAVLLASFVMVAACAASEEAAQVQCLRLADCPAESVCYLGQCVELNLEGEALQVGVELAPPNASGLLPQQLAQSLPVRAEAQQIVLNPTVTVTGEALVGGVPMSGTLLARTPAEPECGAPIPGRSRDFTSSAAAIDTGFKVELPTGRYVFDFVPDDAEMPPLSLNADPCGETIDSDLTLNVDYPESLFEVHGRLLNNESEAVGAAGARVEAIGMGEDGRVVRSTSVITNEPDGDFTLRFPDSVLSVSLRIGPGEQRDFPVFRLDDVELDGDRLESQSLGLRAPVDAQPTFLVDGVALEDAPNARIEVVGTVGRGEVSRSFETVAALGDLRPGDYTVYLLPRSDTPFAAAEADVVIEPGSSGPVPLRFDLTDRREVTGLVQNADGAAPVANAEVTFRSEGLPFTREFISNTDLEGRYRVSVDATLGGEPVRYTVTVEPPPSSLQPNTQLTLEVAEREGDVDIFLAPSRFVFGIVADPEGRVLPDALLSFFRVEAPGARLIGVTQANPFGEFALPLPAP